MTNNIADDTLMVPYYVVNKIPVQIDQSLDQSQSGSVDSLSSRFFSVRIPPKNPSMTPILIQGAAHLKTDPTSIGAHRAQVLVRACPRGMTEPKI